MFTTKILEALDRMKVAAKIKELRKAERLAEKEIPEIKSHPVFTEEVFRVLLKRKSRKENEKEASSDR